MAIKSSEKWFRVFYWGFYLSLFLISGWFASGVVKNFLSKKTSFSQSEDICLERPVFYIDVHWSKTGSAKINLTLGDNLNIEYCPFYSYYRKKWCKYLNLGSNNVTIGKTGKREEVLLEKMFERNQFRLIHLTKQLNERPKASLTVYLNSKLTNTVIIYVTSLKNSLGGRFYKWRDGQQLKYQIEKNTLMKINLRPEKINYLKETSECHEESFYACIATELEKFDFNNGTTCEKKCLPKFFGRKNSSSTIPFCQNLVDEKCAMQIIEKFAEGKMNSSKCKHSCSILQYIGALYAISPNEENNASFLDWILSKGWNKYSLWYEFTNPENKCKVYDQYLIYNAMSMVGSVGGTFGMFIGFAFTGLIEWAMGNFKKLMLGHK